MRIGCSPDSDPMTLHALWQWLKTTRPEEDMASRADTLLRQLDAGDHIIRMQAETHVRRVCGPWGAYEEPEFTIALLDALAQRGDDRALPGVRGLATEPPRRRPVEARVQLAARACLPLLEARVAEQEQRERALEERGRLPRPADNPAAPADRLPRPAGAPPADEATLPRPAEPSDREQ